MSEPLKRFLEQEFKGETLKNILRLLVEEGGVNEIDDLVTLTDEQFKDIGIKPAQMNKIKPALKKFQDEAACNSSTSGATGNLEPLKIFFQKKYIHTDPAKVIDVLTKGGVSKVEDILQWTDDKKFADIGIKGMQLMQIRTFLNQYQAKKANEHSTGPVTAPVTGKEHPIDSDDKKSEDLVSEPQDQDKTSFDYSGQRQDGLVGPQNEHKDLALKQEEVLDRNFNPPNNQQSTSGARKKQRKRKNKRKKDSIPIEEDQSSYQITEESKEEKPIFVIDTSQKSPKVDTISSKSAKPKPTVRDADTKVGSSVDVFHLFKTFEDISSEYKMPKIELIEDQYFKFINSLVQPETQVVGVYGCFQRALEFIRRQFKDKVPDSFKEIEEGIILFKKKDDSQQVFAVYKCPDPEKFYSYTNSTDQASLASTFLRYLVDFCKEIVVIPPDGLLSNPDSSNPFKKNDFYGVKYTFQDDKPQKNCKITEVPYAKVTEKSLPMNLREVVYSSDQSMYLSAVKMNRQEHHTERQATYKSEDFDYKLDSANSDLSYEKVKKIIIESWPSKPQKFRVKEQMNKLTHQICFKNNMKQLLKYFIPSENQQSFIAVCEQFEQKYVGQLIAVKAQIKEKKKIDTNQLIKDYVQKLRNNSCDEFQKRLSFLQKGWKYISSNQDFKCNQNCRSLQSVIKYAANDVDQFSNEESDIFKIGSQALKNYLGSKDFQDLKVHHFFDSETRTIQASTVILKQLLTQKNNRFKVQKQKDLEQISKTILQEFFEEIESLVQKDVQSFTNSVLITFQSINIIRDNDQSIIGWNTSKQPKQLQHQFAKNVTGQIKVKDVIFITEKSGLIHFDDCTISQSSIYHFNFTGPTSSNIVFAYPLQQGAKLLTDPHNFQWCIMSDQEKRIEIGKLKQDGQIHGVGKLYYSIYDRISGGLTIKSIKSACFLPKGDRLLFLNQDGNIFEYKWQSDTLQAIFKKVNKGGSGVEKIQVRPEQSADNYCEIQASTDGKNIILRSNKSIDVYDLNWDRCFSLPIQEDFLSLKTFSDKINNFMIVFTESRQICFQLVGLTSNKILKENKIGKFQDSSHLGNPIFDHFYHSFKKFGPQSTFIGSPEQNNIHLISDKMERNQAQNLIKYFKSLDLSQIGIQEQKNIDAMNLFSNSAIDSAKLKMILLGRVAIHLATIENSHLIPLSNGQYISDTIAQRMLDSNGKEDLIKPLTEIIQFGVYEKFLKDQKRDVKVISIVGKQSSGKSYVMNRFFGTRFNVAAERCTDGIWMSIVEIDKNDESQQNDKLRKTQLFIVLDCEGLFSARRNTQEEIKLCLALTAISDLFIVNQDKSFDRHLDSLFKKFSKMKGQIKGEQLFRGTLMSLIRDVESEEQEGTHGEARTLLQTVNGKNQEFIDDVFQGEFSVQCMAHFQKQEFYRYVEYIRQTYFLALDKPHWISGHDFAESLKIILSQIYIEDDADINIHKIKIQCDRLFEEALQMFYNGGDRFRGEQSILKFPFKIEDEQFAIEVPQSSIKLNKEVYFVEGKEEMSVISKEVTEQFTSQSRIYSIHIHDEWVRSFSSYLRELLEQRTAFILSYLSDLLPKNRDFEDVVTSTLFRLKEQFQIYSQKTQYCDQECRKCKRLCRKKLYHKKNCDCETDHICKAQCAIDESCINGKFLCADFYGHENVHKCNNGNHKCGDICEIPECGKSCSKASGHSKLDVHNCGNRHLCNHKCEDTNCTRICTFDLSNDHQRHYCGEKNCRHKCELCERQCIFPDHFHDKSIVDGKNADLVFTLPDGKSYPMNYHICDQEHQCKSKCATDGICSVAYDPVEKMWESSAAPDGFYFILYNPREKRQVCKIMIKKFEKSHKEEHDCKVVEGHRCGEQCPECKSYCQKDFGHLGHHHTNLHRNKENNVFVSETESSTISIMHQGKKRVYSVGESCKPENCTISCARKGRAHYHIKECKGKEKCDAKTNSKIQHATEKFYPFTSKIYDKWLCQGYWNSFNWDPPIDGEQLEEALGCNYICTDNSHKDERSFCIKSALHQDQHQFDCQHEDKCLQNVIDIVFCCDTTGSMDPYIEKSKDTCKKIMSDVLKLPSAEARTIKFGFFGYRDHPPEEQSYVVIGKPLTDEPQIQEFLKTVTAAGGGDGPEAVMDGLFESIHYAGWRDKSLRYIFHIADAPPHGKRYTGGSKDGFPSGCPCGNEIEKLAAAMKEKKIRYKLLKIGTYPNIMASEFKKVIKDYEESDLDSAHQLQIIVTEILIRDIKQEEIDVMID